MESYILKFDAVTGKRNLPASGNLFVYESATVAANAETRIKVKPDNGGVMVLKPGQWFRNPDDVTGWALESFNGNDVIDAVFVIGFGEFGDANTLNKFTLDASLTNAVTVTNTVANRVPVTLDTTQLLQIAGQTVQYTNSFVDATTAAVAATPIFTAAANVNGAYIEFAEVCIVSTTPSAGEVVTLLAKATAPANATDGDALMVVAAGNTGTAQPVNINQVLGQRIKIAAGKGLYLNQQVGAAVADRCVKTVLYTLL